MSEREFKPIVDEERARQYLKDIGRYEALVENAIQIFGHYPKRDGFLMILTANNEFEQRKY